MRRREPLPKDPPGDAWEWTRWDDMPPPFKRGRVVEIWRPDWRNNTEFIRLEEVNPRTASLGLWWRRA